MFPKGLVLETEKRTYRTKDMNPVSNITKGLSNNYEGEEANDEQPFITLVDQILIAKSENPKSDTSQLERQIDEMVYKLYELTYEEVKAIDPDFWQIEVEYEQIRIE